MISCICGYKGKIKSFGELSFSENISAIGRLNNNHIGSVDLVVCPKCGLVFTDMRNRISIGIGEDNND